MTEEAAGEYENVKSDVLGAYKGTERDLLENVCLLIETRNEQTVNELADLSNSPLVKLSVEARALILGAFAYSLTIGKAAGYLDESGDPTDTMPKELKSARTVLLVQLKDYAEKYDEIMDDDDDSDEDDDEDGEDE